MNRIDKIKRDFRNNSEIITIFEKLDELKSRNDNLHEKELIIRNTHEFFQKRIDGIINEIEELKKSEYAYDAVVESISRDIISLEEILDSAEKKEYEREIYRHFIKELLELLCERSYSLNADLDIIIALSSIFQSPRCYIYPSDNELTFILIINEKYNILTKDFAGLIAHETAHVNQIVQDYAISMNQLRKKIGESLADLLAFTLVGPLYIHSSTYWISNVIGIEEALRSKDWHPSWITRVNVLGKLSDKIWASAFILEKIEEYITKWIAYIDELNIQEQMLLSKCIRDGGDKIKIFNSFKIDEIAIEKLKFLKNKDINGLDTIIQLNNVTI